MLRFLKILGPAVSLLVSACYDGHGLSPTAVGSDASGIRGTITFVGNWPDSTKEVRVAVLRAYPAAGMTDSDSLLGFVLSNLVAYGDTIPRGVGRIDYRMPLEPGSYAWVLVAWFPDIPSYLFGVKELGAFYRNPGKQTLPTAVDVLPGVMVDGVNIVADFSNLNRETPFFKPRRHP
jgi:hypothetical protein